MHEVHLLRSSGASDNLASELASTDREITDLTGDSAASSAAALRRAVRAGEVTRVLIAGGDGLVNLAIQELAGTTVIVGLLPSGTGNDFSSAIGIEDGHEQAFGSPESVDLIGVDTVDGRRWVASIAIAGFPAAINARANRLPARLGGGVYTLAALLELPSFARTFIEVELDGDPVALDTAMLAIGNTRFFGGGMLACPDALHNDGLLHVTSIEGVGRLGIIRHLNSRGGGSADRPEVIRRTAKSIRINTPGISIWGDGEPIGASPLTLTIEPGALLVASVHNAPIA